MQFNFPYISNPHLAKRQGISEQTKKGALVFKTRPEQPYNAPTDRLVP